jgi:signal transduction histidine kinase
MPQTGGTAPIQKSRRLTAEGPAGRESPIRGKVPGSLVADLSRRAAGAVPAPRTRALVAAPEPAPARAWLAELEAAFARYDGHPDTAAAFATASARARSLAAAAGGDDGVRSAALTFAADAITGLLLERVWLPETVAEMVETVGETLELSDDVASLELFLRAAANPKLLELPPALTLELHLRLLVKLSPITDASLWTGGQVERLRCLVHVGDAPPTRRMRNVARSTLDGASDGSTGERGSIHSVAVTRWQQPYAVLVARARPDDRRRTMAFLEEAAERLAPVFERDMLLERNAGRERSLVEASEKRLSRLGFDLHDGPLQDLAALAADVRLAQGQVADHISGRGRKLVTGRLQDLGSQIGELDRTLRELARSLEPTSILEQPLVEILRHEVEAFEARAEMRVELEVGGDFEGLTASQRIALYRLVQEGLSNVREHSGATEVYVRVHAGEHHLEVQIVDNGHGFEVAQTLIRAAKRGRLGLVGIGERVRLLGGSLDVQSRPGGPTTVSLVLPRWRPVAADAEQGSDPSGV